MDIIVLEYFSGGFTDAPNSTIAAPLANQKQAVALGEAEGPASSFRNTKSDDNPGGNSGVSDEDALQARLDALRRG